MLCGRKLLCVCISCIFKDRKIVKLQQKNEYDCWHCRFCSGTWWLLGGGWSAMESLDSDRWLGLPGGFTCELFFLSCGDGNWLVLQLMVANTVKAQNRFVAATRFQTLPEPLSRLKLWKIKGAAAKIQTCTVVALFPLFLSVLFCPSCSFSNSKMKKNDARGLTQQNVSWGL